MDIWIKDKPDNLWMNKWELTVLANSLATNFNVPALCTPDIPRLHCPNNTESPV